ncbi:MAG TPA: HigA family addiction module antitoxin [Candidatus Dormibacteraeota bacterium]|nr:HigA family addiction module antitoxin [Candidatus Dormibacteraeota bacterium]
MSKPKSLLPPVHPGEILELLVPATRIGEIVHQRRSVTADTALRLACYLHTNPEFWLNLRNCYDLEVSRCSGTMSEIERYVYPR